MEKVEKVTFSAAMVLYDMKMLSNSTTKKFYRSRSFGDLGQRLLVSCLYTFSKDFSEIIFFYSLKFKVVIVVNT